MSGCSWLKVNCFVILVVVVGLVHSTNVWIIQQQSPWPNRVIEFDSINVFVQSILNKSVSIQSHSSIRLSPGDHIVTVALSKALSISNVYNLSMLVGYPNLTHGLVAKVTCQATFGLSFLYVGNLHIAGIHFEGCGAPSQLSLGFRESVNVVVETNLSMGITLDHVSITRSSGIGLLLQNVHTDLMLSNLQLSDNYVNCYINCQHTGISECFDYSGVINNIPYVYMIRHSSLSFGKSCDETICNSSASGLTAVFNQLHFLVELSVYNVTFQDNAGTGGNILINTSSCSKIRLLNFTVLKSVFSESYSGEQQHGLTYNELQCSCKGSVERNVNISQSFFHRSCISAEQHNNLGLAASVSYTTLKFEHTMITHSNCTQSSLELHSIKDVLFDSLEISESRSPFSLRVVNRLRLETSYYSIILSGLCIFKHNKGGISIKGDYVRLLRSTHLKFADNSTTTIAQNTVKDQRGHQYGATMYISDVIVELLEGSHTQFEENEALLSGGITAIRSQLRVSGSPDLVFKGNVGGYGGAIGLYEKSEFIFYQSNATIEFRNNSALSYGGGLYIDDSSYLERISNQYVAPYFSLYCCSPSLNFYNNSAVLGGSAMYGGWIDWVNYRYIFLIEHNISQFIHIESRDGDLSPIASSPTRICVCISGKPDCSIPASYKKYEIYRGETLDITVVAVGQRNGTVASTVIAKFIPDNVPLRSHHLYKQTTNAKLGPLERIQIVGHNCTKLKYTPASSNNNERLKLTVSNGKKLRFADKTIEELIKNPKYKIQFTDLQLDITFKPCPFGFQINTSTGLCTCVPLPQSSTYDLYCKGQQPLQLFRKEFTWVGVTTDSPSTVIFGLCPFDYCIMNETAVSSTMLDEQCNFNRSGILCGGCRGNLSRVFDTSVCKDCSGTQVIPILIGLALAGVGLVVMLLVLNLTISIGSINSLIFYANIVSVNHVMSFLPQNFSHSFLRKFISVLSMGTGAETCFYNGMSTYAQSWILFVFPCYIWFLSVIIITLSHYSSKVSRWLGRNPVQVLATLFLLSYSKVLQITITTSAFAFTSVSSVNGRLRYVWLLDGNVPYLGLKHALLFTATLLLFVFVCVPYTLILVSVQWLQRYSHKQVLRWVLKLKPFIDAHTGPYKDKHRYWTGFLLLVRAGTFFLFTLNSQRNELVNPALVIVITLCLIFYLLFVRGVYKSRLLNIIEIAFLFNLCILSTSSLFQVIFNTQAQNVSLYIAYVSVGSAFGYTCLVIFYHTAVRISITPLGTWIKGIIPPNIYGTVKKQLKYKQLMGLIVDDDEYKTITRPSVQCVTHSSIAIREGESLLSDSYE